MVRLWMYMIFNIFFLRINHCRFSHWATRSYKRWSESYKLCSSFSDVNIWKFARKDRNRFSFTYQSEFFSNNPINLPFVRYLEANVMVDTSRTGFPETDWLFGRVSLHCGPFWVSFAWYSDVVKSSRILQNQAFQLDKNVSLKRQCFPVVSGSFRWIPFEFRWVELSWMQPLDCHVALKTIPALLFQNIIDFRCVLLAYMLFNISSRHHQ